MYKFRKKLLQFYLFMRTPPNGSKIFSSQFDYKEKFIKFNELRIQFTKYLMLCAIWYYLSNFKNVKNTHGSVLILVTKSKTPPSVFFTFFKWKYDTTTKLRQQWKFSAWRYGTKYSRMEQAKFVEYSL